MSKTYYECHITMQVNHNIPLIEKAVAEIRWKFSIIMGDINLGDGPKAYATIQLNSRMTIDYVVALLKENARFLKKAGIKILRRKVELVVFDDRSSKVGACDDCAACHIEDAAI